MTIGSRERGPCKVTGFSLIETLVSVAILSVGTVVIMQTLANIAHAQMVAEHQASAYVFAASKMADVELAARRGETFDDAQHGTFWIGPQQFNWQVASAEVPEDPTRRHVALSVDWRMGARAYEQRLETVLKVEDESTGE